MYGYIIVLIVAICAVLWFVGCLRRGHERAAAQTYSEQLAAYDEWNS